MGVGRAAGPREADGGGKAGKEDEEEDGVLDC